MRWSRMRGVALTSLRIRETPHDEIAVAAVVVANKKNKTGKVADEKKGTFVVHQPGRRVI